MDKKKIKRKRFYQHRKGSLLFEVIEKFILDNGNKNLLI